MDQIQVGIVEDDNDTREGLSLLLNHAPGFECRHVYTSVETALEGLREGEPPQVLLLDIGLPGLDGITGVRLFHEKVPWLAIVMLTVLRDEERVFRAICAGACGYLLKTTEPERILSHIREVAQGGAAMSPEIASRVIQLFRRKIGGVSAASGAGRPSADFTAQEQRLLKLLGNGHSNKTAAAEMYVSVHTVGFHLRSIYRKLHVHSRAEAVARALREGLI